MEKFKVNPEQPVPCAKCGSIPEVFIDKETLTVVFFCKKCQTSAGYSVYGAAAANWNDEQRRTAND